MNQIAYIDGTFLDLREYAVQMEDRGYMMGDGVCETLRVYGGKPFAVKKHFKRYHKSMRELNIPITDTDLELFSLFNEMVAKSGISEGLLYFQLTRGTAKRRLASPMPSLPHFNAILSDTPLRDDWQRDGVRLVYAQDVRWLRCDISSLNLLGNVMAADAAAARGADGALLFRKHSDTVTETADANFWLVKDGVLWTHPADNYVLNGVTRQLIKEKIAPQLDLTIVEKAFKREFVAKADEAFISSTANEIVPVTRLERGPVGDGTPGETTRQLQAAYRELVRRGVDSADEDNESDEDLKKARN